MFEKLRDADYWKRMVIASARSWRQRQAAQPIGSLLGWDVWTMDGKAYLFRDGRVRRADWFEFCHMLRWMFHHGPAISLQVA